MSGRPRWRGALAGVVFLAAFAWFAIGVSLTFEWVDEGMIVYPCWRVARGDLPYRDFQHWYFPTLFYLNAGLLRVFGEDLRVIRLSLVALKALASMLVYATARRVARPWLALTAAAVFTAVWGSPFWLFATPYASHYTLTAALLGALVLASGPPTVARALAGGLALGGAITCKQTTGLFAASGLLLGLLTASGDEAAADASLARRLRWLLAGGAALLGVGYVMSPPSWTGSILALPWLCVIATALTRPSTARLAPALAAALAMAAPALLWLAYFAWQGVLPAMIGQTLVGLPQRLSWLIPLGTPPPSIRLEALALVAGGLALARWHSHRHLALVAATVAAAASAATLLPSGRGTEAALHTLRWLPLAAGGGGAVLAWGTRRATTSDARTLLLLAALGSGTLLSLYPGADLPHAANILPPFLPLAAAVGERLVRRAAAPRSAAVAILAVATVFAWPFAARTWTTRTALPATAVDALPRATGIWQPDAAAHLAATAEVVRRVDALVPPAQAFLLVPSQQILYFLAGRPSAVPTAEFVLYILGTGFMRADDARALIDPAQLIARLDAGRPLVVRAPRDPAYARVLAAFPELRAWLESGHVVRERIGPYEILVRGDASG